MIHQFNQLSIGGASTSPKADSGNNAKDVNNATVVAISPNQKGNNSKKWRKKTTVNDAFVSQGEERDCGRQKLYCQIIFQFAFRYFSPLTIHHSTLLQLYSP
jgi:hypothetical protein